MDKLFCSECGEELVIYPIGVTAEDNPICLACAKKQNHV